MIRFLTKFSHDEDGAITVDYVVITAAVAFVGLAVGLSISTGAIDWAERAEKSLTDRPLGTDW